MRHGMQMFRPDDETWQRFFAATKGQPAWGRLVKAASMFDTPADALDVGAGAGRDTSHLLASGWNVTAIDASPAAVELLRKLGPADRLRVVRSAAQDFEPGDYDLVNAQFSLPFVPPARFAATVDRLKRSVRPGGVMAVTFFGPRDEWNAGPTDLTFTTKEEVADMFRGWEIVELTEIEEDGMTATGGTKHWDVIHLIVRKEGGRSG
jgi:SAM-dependent methyltransferase